jgi:prevent-host-death family protein
MSTRLTIRELQERLPELLDQVVRTGEEYMVQRNGKDYAVVVSAREWKRRMLGKSLDARGDAYRLAPEKQKRAEVLLLESKRRRLSRSERNELNALLRECDEILVTRTKAMNKLS